MPASNRLPGDAGYCDECCRFAYLPTHDCDDLPPVHSLKQQIRRVAADDGVGLRQCGPAWVARDTTTNEQASDHTMAGAWAMLRDVEPAIVYDRLAEAGVDRIPSPARTVDDISRSGSDP